MAIGNTKHKTTFFCQNCGYESTKWAGKCPACNEWNTFVEEPKEKKNATPAQRFSWEQNTNTHPNTVTAAKAQLIEDIEATNAVRIQLPDEELNRTLGGGLVLGSVTLVAGDPGIGKSTLFLQCALAANNIRILYVSGEESAHQIKLRAQRIGLENPNLYLLVATNTQDIFQEVKNLQPNWVIIDSIQTLNSPYVESAPGSVSQVRECAAELQQFAKMSNIPVAIIGHITKDGTIAGPKVLEHMVDTVLQFEGDRHYAYRLLRTLKNRFGSTAELGIYEMHGSGMKGIPNPSEILFTQHEEDLSGISIASAVEGIRPMMIEIQALVSHAVYGTPQRTVNGFDLRRLQLLLAVLEKRGGFQFGTKDVFLNIAGGLKIEDTAIDLSIICALLSSYNDTSLPKNVCFVGEVGLSGEIRAVNRIEQRIAEAEKMGMDMIVIPKSNAKGLELEKYAIKVLFAGKVADIYQQFFM